MRRRFSEETEREIVELYESDKVRTMKELGEIYSCSRWTVKKLLDFNQIPMKTKSEVRRRRFSEEDKQKIVDWYKSGEVRSMAELAEFYSCSTPAIKRLLVAKQIPIRTKSEARRKIRGITEEVKARFWKKVSIQEGNQCWLWQAGIADNGYGKFWFDEKQVSAHRFSWYLKFGEIPPEKFVLHHCDVKRCVNPNHLFLGNHLDNMFDMAKKGRSTKGEANTKSKLKNEDIPKIREMSNQGVQTKEIAEIFNVSRSAITRVKSGRNWSHI